MLYKELGLIAQVLDERRLPSLRGSLAIAHCRYSTTGSTVWENAQPTFRMGRGRSIAIGHNGNLVNTRELLSRLEGGKTPAAGHDGHGAADRASGRRSGRRHRRRAQARPADRPGRLLAGDPRREAGHRRPRSVRLPAARARPPRARAGRSGGQAFGRLGASRPNRPRSKSPAATVVRDVEPGEMVILEEGKRAGFDPVRPRARAALRLRADLLRPAGLVHARPQPLRVAPPDGRCPRGRSRRSTRIW